MPIGINRLADIAALRDELKKHGAALRLHIDHPDQILALEAFESSQPNPNTWSAFLKLDCGDK